MSLHVWLTFVFVALAVSILPGPAVVTVVSTSLRRGFLASLRTNAGVLLGEALFVAAAAAGLGAVIVASHPLFVAIRFIGIAYLAYLGVRAFLRGAVAWLVWTSTYGLIIAATARNEVRARALGLSIVRPRIIAFVLSGAMFTVNMKFARQMRLVATSIQRSRIGCFIASPRGVSARW
jgi:threonine/homoserine/homoserine lactone efflux protein